ncbi:response regulator transcription factor [Undibacterium oligocarboniphilum]|uniref:Response regulator n=1 Tax=Undibacterium oligocarboniphilum TaxID=666702 RepID=A0A850QJI1_9BURK|nr:response regulator [Undibacterium oligocarboniphilum]MBC3871186.1 response regulator [Undibacterium oligocarboniphilum]NVO79277.1 response regulator [Undibacterium oligocarboniphilum]
MKKLLIVDDSKVSRMVIRAHIKAAQPDWEFAEAGSGEEALRVAAEHHPDFCTMDINMPGMLGTDAAEALLKAHPAMRIAIFSANVQDAMQTRANSIGTIFVAKPVTEKSIGIVVDYFVSGQ